MNTDNTIIRSYLNEFSKHFPVEWDRYTRDDNYFEIYGWIKRRDENRDFVLLQLTVVDRKINGGFTTSSAKYSEAICRYMFGAESEHSHCIKVSDL